MKDEQKELSKHQQKMAQSKKGGRGTHGSTTKAGKVRVSTPKVEKTVKHKPTNPRVRNRRNFEKREILGRRTSQKWM